MLWQLVQATPLASCWLPVLYGRPAQVRCEGGALRLEPIE